ncbi:CDP-glycerol glycerophosphotransferase family protein [Haloimpatiens sp. FM7315]|uniref:CDP-glycerol glycerophosphotransferase family protein n=1 Tax=Haloimpatiens sp. FM7315 TaxID=3298609 RepID=UPI00370AF2E4
MNTIGAIAQYIDQDKIEEALNLIIKNEKELFHEPEFWNLKAILCIKTGEYKTAIGCLNNVLKLDNENADAYYNLAYIYESLNIFSDSAIYYGFAEKYTNNEELKKELESVYSDKEALLTIKNCAKNTTKKTFIILSSCGFTGILQRMHHIAKALVKLGNEVLYVSSSIEYNLKNAYDTNTIIKYINENVKVVDGVKIYQPLNVSYTNENTYYSYFDLVQYLLDKSKNDVEIIPYLPSQVNVIKALKGDFKVIYECVDDNTDLQYAFWGNKNNVVWEQELMDVSEAITTTATSLYLQRTSIEKRKNVYMSRNAVNEADFIVKDEKIPEDLKNIPEPRIVYTGAIFDWFDKELFYDVVKSNPDKSFVIIGFGEDEILNEKCNNVYMIGPKKHSELKNYLRNCQIGIIPFRDNLDLIVNCDPIKQYEYIACGLPVITTCMPESAMNKKYTFLANTKENFNKAIEKCLNLKVDLQEIKDFIAENSWNARAALICNIADGKINEEYRRRDLKKIGENLNNISNKYNSPIFETLKGLYLNFKDSKEFEKCVKKAYQENQCNFIEKKYLEALYENNNIIDFINVVSESKNISKELKGELNNLENRTNANLLKINQCLCLRRIKKALELIDSLKDMHYKILYNTYLECIFDENIKPYEVEYISMNLKGSSLYNFIKEKYDLSQNSQYYLIDMYNDINEEFVSMLLYKGINIKAICNNKRDFKYGINTISLNALVEMQSIEKINILVPYDLNYINQVICIAEKGVINCDIVVINNNKLQLINIDKDLMNSIRTKKYNNTVTFNEFNAADGNVHALIKYAPDKIKNKYNFNIIKGKEVWSIENIVKVPLISKITVSGFATFLYNYPKFTYNIEVGHGGVTLKACGLMDKTFKNSGATPDIYKKVDTVCVDSQLDMVVLSSFYAIPENIYRITGLPRYDMLKLENSRKNLEDLLGADLSQKKIIFNMPTFHIFDDCNRVEGSVNLDANFKIKDFNYQQFDEFLESNNAICVSKVHHGEEKSTLKKQANIKYKNLFFINNNDLDNKGYNLYEILGSGDLLITDYSTVYNDFLYMDKPAIFVTADIDQYRKNRGLSLEPYDFWTAGPKVQTQLELEKKIKECFLNSNFYDKERKNLSKAFFKYNDKSSTSRVWSVIDRAFKKS